MSYKEQLETTKKYHPFAEWELCFYPVTKDEESRKVMTSFGN